MLGQISPSRPIILDQTGAGHRQGKDVVKLRVQYINARLGRPFSLNQQAPDLCQPALHGGIDRFGIIGLQVLGRRGAARDMPGTIMTHNRHRISAKKQRVDVVQGEAAVGGVVMDGVADLAF